MSWRDSAGRIIRPTCDDGVRHWFTVYGVVGVRAPVCQRHGCGAANPRPLSVDELATFDAVTEGSSSRGGA